MKASQCDDCKSFYEPSYRGSYYSVRDGVSTFYILKGSLDLCDKCWNKMLKEVFKDMEVKE